MWKREEMFSEQKGDPKEAKVEEMVEARVSLPNEVNELSSELLGGHFPFNCVHQIKGADLDDRLCEFPSDCLEVVSRLSIPLISRAVPEHDREANYERERLIRVRVPPPSSRS